MIKVAPPKGWVPPAPAPSESKPDALPHSATGVTDSNFDFDDIDQLLAKPDQIAAAQQPTSRARKNPNPQGISEVESQKVQPPKRAAAPAVAPRVTPQRKKPASAVKTSGNNASDTATHGEQANDSQPLLPNQNWESEKSKGQKAWLRILAAILGIILLSGFIFAMMSSNRGQPPKNVSKNLDETGDVQPSDSDPADTEPVETAADTEPDPTTSDAHFDNANLEPQPSDDTTTDPTVDLSSNPDGSNTASATPQPQLTTDLPSGSLAETTDTQPKPQTSPTGSANSSTEDSQQPAPRLPSPFFRNTETEAPIATKPKPTRKQPGVGIVNKIEKQMGDLAGLLEESGASLSELRDATVEASGTSLAGIPKYVIEKPGPIKPDLERLNLNVGGLLFEKTPLPVVVRELSSLSGVPITIDARSLEAAGKDINQQISATIKNADLNTAMDRILAPLGITKQSGAIGLRFTVANSLDFKEANYSVAQFAGLSDQDKKSFLSYIQAMIEPDIWVRAEDPATIQLQDDDIVAQCPADLHAQIERLISKLMAANALISDPADPAAINKTLTRSEAILSKLEAPIENQHTIRTPIGLFLTKLQSKSSVTVVVDWENLAEQGWNPRTLVPGNIDEPTAGDTVKQLAQSMNLSVVAIDANTVMLTTVEQAAVTRDIEVYPVAKLLAGKFNEDQLKQAFETTLGFELRNEKYVYDSSCQCFIVAASQSKQRQVEALLKRLQGI